MLPVPPPLTSGGTIPSNSSPSAPLLAPHFRLLHRLENLQLLGLHLMCTGGSVAAAKILSAPLDRTRILLQTSPWSVDRPPIYAGMYAPLASAAREVSTTRIYSLPGGGGKSLNPAPRPFEALAASWAREGPRSYFRGNGANIMRVPLEISIKFFVADQFKVMFTPQLEGRDTFWLPFLAGAATQSLKTTALYPLDLARTRLASDTTVRGRQGLYKGVWDTLEIAYVREGLVKGWYKGLGLSLLGSVPHFAATLGTYESLNAQLPSARLGGSIWWYPYAKIGAGATAATAATALLYPIDTLRRRRQVAGSLGFIDGGWTQLGALRMGHRIIQQEGVGALYRGLSLVVVKTLPATFVQLTVYDLLRSVMLFKFKMASATPL